MENKIRTLIDWLNARTKEYDEGTPTVSDIEWDNKYFELVSLEAKTGIYLKDSPTQKVNFYFSVNELKKVTHSHEMLSLAKTKDREEVRKFLHSFGDTSDAIVMAKMDGLTCSLEYNDGILVRAETRGDGKIGEDIFHNALVIENIPKKINYKEKLVVDGEIICTKNNFEVFKNEYKNPRNFAAGSIRLLDNEECQKRKLSFVAWDVIEGFKQSHFQWTSSRLYMLADLGFTIVPLIDTNEDDLEDNEQLILKEVERLGYPIDGLVYKIDDIALRKQMGKTEHHFKDALAFKFYDEEYESELLDIEWSMGRTGVLTPVAVFKDIDIDGTTVSKASLHNLSILEEILGKPYVGQKIWIVKKNQIIPQITKAEKENSND